MNSSDDTAYTAALRTIVTDIDSSSLDELADRIGSAVAPDNTAQAAAVAAIALAALVAGSTPEQTATAATAAADSRGSCTT